MALGVFVDIVNIVGYRRRIPTSPPIASTLPDLGLSEPHTAVAYIRGTECMRKDRSV